MVKNIALIPGDGIGPDITEQAVRVLIRLEKNLDIHLIMRQYLQVSGY